MRFLTPAGAWQAVVVSAAFLVGGFTMMAAGIPPPWWIHSAGLGAVLLGLLIFLAAMIQLSCTQKRRRQALAILDQLISLGDPVARDGTDVAINQWRDVVGVLMTTPPFRVGLQHTVLGGQGRGQDWITEALHRLRDMALHFDDDWLA